MRTLKPGDRFEKLTVVSIDVTTKDENNHHKYYHLKCDRGNTVRVRADHLIRGKKLSCGYLIYINGETK